MRRLGATLLTVGGLWLVPAAQAQEPPAEPGLDLDFLEYLGSWQGEDDEWLAIEEWRKGDGQEGSDERQGNEDEEGE
jgi:hypothetical protein